jgi:hypothetical protein
MKLQFAKNEPKFVVAATEEPKSHFFWTYFNVSDVFGPFWTFLDVCKKVPFQPQENQRRRE